MQYRTVRVKSKGIELQYGQIVESFRRPADGMPSHRVMASLGRVTDQQAATLKKAFAAIRLNAAIQVLEPGVLPAGLPTVAWSRDLADAAACLQAWRDVGLASLVGGLLADHEEEVAPADIVAALVVQRCIAPASKLAACRWFAQTALPELLGIAPARFHNTRVHRVLDRLESVEDDLKKAMGNQMVNADGRPCTAFFIDCTDTWFTGEGPPMARRGKTKEEFYREKVGIVLLCRDDGMPLHFEVIQGNTDDGVAMLRLMRSLGAEAWLCGAPLVCDRALGNTADLLEMTAMDLQFVTALVASEHAAYGATVHCPGLADLDPSAPDCLLKAAAEVVKAGMIRHADDLYLLDLWVVQHDQAARDATAAALPDARSALRGTDLSRDMLLQARRFEHSVASGKVTSLEAVRRGLGRSSGYLHRIMSLLKLPEEVQAQIEAGTGKYLSKKAIVRVCQGRDPALHRAVFASECAKATARPRTQHQPTQPGHDHGSPWVQLTVVFNPEIWRHKRLAAAQREAHIHAELAKQNKRLAAAAVHPVSHAQAQVVRVIADQKLASVYEVKTVQPATGAPYLEVTRNEDKWRARRARDGFNVIAASPSVNLTPLERVRLYRSKDRIEKDFREIKSVLELRPIHHRTDAKVRAHVTLCILALAVRCRLKQQLVSAGRSESPDAALQVLRTLPLVGLKLSGVTDIIATPTAPTAEQQALVEALRVGWAVDAKGLSGKLNKVRD